MATATRTRERVCPFCGQENAISAMRCVQCQQLLAPKPPITPIRSAAQRTTNTRWVLIGLLLGCLPGVLVYLLAYSGLNSILPLWATGPLMPLLVGSEGIWAINTAIGTQQKSRRLLAAGIIIGLCLSLLIRYSISTTVYM